MVATLYTILRPEQDAERIDADLPVEPGYDALKALIRPLLAGGDFEHVTVLHDGKRADMFVDGDGIEKGLPRNAIATKVYRNNALMRSPGTPPESLPAIYGTAVLFDRRVWF